MHNAGRCFGELQTSGVSSNFYRNYNHLNQANGKSTRDRDDDFQVDSAFDEEKPFRPSNPLPGSHSYNYMRGTYPEPSLNQYGQFRQKKHHPKYIPLKKNELELFNNAVEQGERFGDQYGFDKDTEIFISGGSDESVHELRIQNFQECRFSPIMLKTITQCSKYRYPTPIQRAVIPLIMNSRDDIMGYSQTGSGKTAAFLIPIIHELQWVIQTQNVPKNSPLCIILSPTKELTEQLYQTATAFALKTGVTVARSFGDMPMRETLAEKENGCDIFVVTSGRLRHHLDDSHINISHLRYFVLDEGDKLIEESHFNVSIEACKLHPNYPSTTRLLIFSASFTDDVQMMADRFLRKGYIFVKIGQINQLVDTVEQEFIEVPKIEKDNRLLEIMRRGAVEKILTIESQRYFKPKYKTLIFVSDKRRSDRTAMFLKQQGFKTMSINADRTLKQRLEAYEKFKSDQYDVLVASDVAARGLDIRKIQLVINYDLPLHERGDESYIHRIGRTGRAGNVGFAISFFDPGESSNVQKADIYIKYLKAKNIPVPDFLLRHSIENRKETLRQFHMDGRIYEERENAFGDQNYGQENGYQRADNRSNQGLNNGMQQMNLNEPEDGLWGLLNSKQKTNGRQMQNHQQNNLNRNWMASTSAPKKSPTTIFDLDDDDEENSTMRNGQCSSKSNVPAYQVPNNYGHQPRPLNNYQHQPKQNGYTAYQNGNRENMEKNQSNFNNNTNGFPVHKECDWTRFPSPYRNRNINKHYGIRADMEEQKYPDCF